MTVHKLIDSAHLNPISVNDGEREIVGAYVGDLLSWVMGRASADNVWITIMSNVNVIAVASLIDISCVILAEGVTLDEDVMRVAKEKGVNILGSSLPVYETAKLIAGIIE